MSESDDTDILLLIPPDLFTVASSQSEESLVNYHHHHHHHHQQQQQFNNSTVVSEILEHVQALEDRINAIEVKDSSLERSSYDLGPAEPRIAGAISGSYNTNSTDIFNEKNYLDTRSSSSLPITRKSYLKSHNYIPGPCCSGSSISTPSNSPVKKKYDDLEFIKTSPIIRSEFSEMKNDQRLSLNTSRERIESPKQKLEFPKFIVERSKLWDSKKTVNTSTPKKELSNKSEDFFQKKNDWKTPLLSLTDFWTPDPTKSQDEIVRIRLEEEKFRREHCEQMIQELQKKLLEQQEKIAVAIRVDKDKSDTIIQFQEVWTKFKARWDSLEHEHTQLKSRIQDLTADHHQQLESLNSKVCVKDEEINRLENLLKESDKKCETAVRDKLTTLEEHANELEKYKSLVQAADQRSEEFKSDFYKSKDLVEQLEQTVKSLQQELYKERLKNTEIRSEMSVVHKAVDTCEAELIVLRQEKENLLLKLKEEENRVSILEKNKMMLLEDVNNTKKSEDLVKEEIKSLIAQHELKKTELRNMYQKQVDDVVNTKLKEFEAQLDTAELNFQLELESKQRAIAECAARKIKSIIDKHQVEINLIEEKHKEEKRLCEIRLSQTNKKAQVYETQLTAYHNAKSRLAEQLHSLMEKQYHQALHILTTGSTETFQLPRVDKSAELINLLSGSNFNNTLGTAYLEPVKYNFKDKDKEKEEKRRKEYVEKDNDESVVTYCNSSAEDFQAKQSDNDDLKKYIKMILQMQNSQKLLDNNLLDNDTNKSSSPPLVCREVPKKYYLKADSSKDNSNEELYRNRSTEDISTTINTEYFTIEKNKCRTPGGRNQEKIKPPWK